MIAFWLWTQNWLDINYFIHCWVIVAWRVVPPRHSLQIAFYLLPCYTRGNVWAVSFTFNINRFIFDSFGFGFRQWNFRGANPAFDQMQLAAVTLVIMGLVAFLQNTVQSKIGFNIDVFIAHLWCRNWLGVVKSCLKRFVRGFRYFHTVISWPWANRRL